MDSRFNELTSPLLYREEETKHNLTLISNTPPDLKIWQYRNNSDLARRFLVGSSRFLTLATLILLDYESSNIIDKVSNDWGAVLLSMGIAGGIIESTLSCFPKINRIIFPHLSVGVLFYENFLFKGYTAIRFFCPYPTQSDCIDKNKMYLGLAFLTLPIFSIPSAYVEYLKFKSLLNEVPVTTDRESYVPSLSIVMLASSMNLSLSSVNLMILAEWCFQIDLTLLKIISTLTLTIYSCYIEYSANKTGSPLYQKLSEVNYLVAEIFRISFSSAAAGLWLIFCLMQIYSKEDTPVEDIREIFMSILFYGFFWAAFSAFYAQGMLIITATHYKEN
ncbi:MAG: hypothetical protein ACE365_03650 [Gammaproteobacteria bacterium]